ncbi:TPA_asm: coat protein [ssRNA phage SRR5466725_16]|uniref:Coat protein n=1 Tax=ssRNA phage SRR5466725_16 TaxID=2786414 RepID=A0A8S5L501_9VIRU|nr:coat protein [ssRNA phage SRR5466725_16]DAD52413.1 TPA_asm: coat protein [ssRNA phage SRR5466725_16]
MASIADINLANYAAVSKTFAARSSDGSLATWNEMSSGLYIGNPVVTLGQRLPGPNVRTYKVSLKVKLPTMAVTAPTTMSGIQPSPTVAYTNMFSGDFVMGQEASLTERRDLLAFSKNLLSHAVVTDAIENFRVPS